VRILRSIQARHAKILHRAGYAAIGEISMTPVFEQGSFRDRRARVFRIDGGIYRCLDETAWRNWLSLKEAPFFRDLVARGSIPATHEVSSECLPNLPEADLWRGILEHERLPVITYPFEWSFSRLKDAALFHLDLMRCALDDGWILKDASSFNIQWKGSRPIFIDIPSFEPLSPGEPWVGYRQFCEMFLNPLLLAACKGVPFQPWLRGSFGGIEVDQMARLLTWRDFLLYRGALVHVYAHARLQRAMKGSSSVSKASLKSAGYDKNIVRANINAMRRVVGGLYARRRISHWTDYGRTHSYSAADYELKQAFVVDAARERRWKTAWDIGCNTGEFSRIVAPNADIVLALDSDEGAVERLYENVRDEGIENIVALVYDLTNPSPALGWRVRERAALADRRPADLVLALGIIHHIVLGANIPLGDFVDWLAGMNAAIVLEFVSKNDEMAEALLRNKPDLHAGYDEHQLRAYLERRFEVRRTQPLKGGLRTLYYAIPKT
jgi:hypothetical protein